MAGSADVIFGIGTIASIRSVNLNTSLGPIRFYIVPVNTLFWLCLADIDKHGVFFNNITNQVIIVPHTRCRWCLPAQRCIGLNIVFFKHRTSAKLLYHQNTLKLHYLGIKLYLKYYFTDATPSKRNSIYAS